MLKLAICSMKYSTALGNKERIKEWEKYSFSPKPTWILRTPQEIQKQKSVAKNQAMGKVETSGVCTGLEK